MYFIPDNNSTIKKKYRITPSQNKVTCPHPWDLLATVPPPKDPGSHFLKEGCHSNWAHHVSICPYHEYHQGTKGKVKLNTKRIGLRSPVDDWFCSPFHGPRGQPELPSLSFCSREAGGQDLAQHGAVRSGHCQGWAVPIRSEVHSQMAPWRSEELPPQRKSNVSNRCLGGFWPWGWGLAS